MTPILNEFKHNGIVTLENESFESFEIFNEKIQSEASDFVAHDGQNLDPTKLNSQRLKTFRALNNISDWENLYFNMAGKTLSQILGPDILIQRKLNFSIQVPNDTTSRLGMHTDTLSGQSPFEIVMWTAFTDAFDTNSMFYFDRETSAEIFSEMASTEREGLEELRKKFWAKARFLNVKKSSVVIFSSTIFHGNVTNQTEQTRMSVNCRFKNLFSPGGHGSSADRGVGIFYKLLSESPLTSIGREYLDREINFEL